MAESPGVFSLKLALTTSDELLLPPPLEISMSDAKPTRVAALRDQVRLTAGDFGPLNALFGLEYPDAALRAGGRRAPGTLRLVFGPRAFRPAPRAAQGRHDR